MSHVEGDALGPLGDLVAAGEIGREDVSSKSATPVSDTNSAPVRRTRSSKPDPV
ncbi:hypothetical protein [Streptomyces liangshanensis]|uniref:hypothetical protein n=1 Tax=Streptomyces liangshanensis TaxID=2717324 RepID=UPI0036D9FF1B